jgi:arylsulfotransferase
MEQPAFKEDKYSRAVEYKIDEKKGTVEQTWQFGKERGFDFYSAVTSNVEWQKDKSTYFISSSNVNLLRPDKTIKMVLVEIDPKTNDIKFEMDVDSASRDDVAYRAMVIDPEVFSY